MRSGLLVLLLSAATAYGSFERAGNLLPGPAATALAVPGSVWTAFANPGGLASLTTRTLAVSHAPQPFGLSDLVRSSLAYVEPLPFGTAALTIQRYGNTLYREITGGVAFGIALDGGWSAGVGLNVYSLAIAGYGSASTAGIDAGMAIDLADDLRAGMAALNVNAPAIGRAGERLPQTLALGLCYRPINGVALAMDLTKDLRYAPDLIAGIEVVPVRMLRLFAGSGTEPSQFRAGMAVRYDVVEVGYAYTSHPDLGATHQVSLELSLTMF